MKPKRKILKVIGLIVAVVVAMLFSISLIMQDKVADIFIRSLNSNISTKLEIGSFRLSLLKRFPRASFELRDVIVHSSPGLDPGLFSYECTDTLLTAKNVSVEFSMINLIAGKYTANRIGIKSGRVNLFSDSNGNTNYNIYWKDQNESGDKEAMTLNLEKVYLTDVRAVYNDLSVKLAIEGDISGGQIRSRISGNNIDFATVAGLEISLFQLEDLKISHRFMTSVDLNLQKSDSGIKFSRGIIGIEGWDFLLTGFITADNYVDLDISGNNIDIARVTRFFPPKYREMASAYRPSGILKVNGKIKGASAGSLSPHVDVSFSLNNAYVKYAKSKLAIDNFSFDGSFTNGARNKSATTSLAVKNFTGKLGSAEYKGSFTLSDFTSPTAEVRLRGMAYPAELKEFFNLQNITNAGGSVSIDLNLSGKTNRNGKFKLSDLIDLNSQSEFVFNSFKAGFRKENLEFSEVNGNILFARKTLVRDMNLIFNGQKLRINGELTNFPGWLAGRPVTMAISANIISESFRPEPFYSDTPGAEAPKKAPLTFPGNVTADITFAIDTFTYKSFTGRDISGVLNYKPKVANFRSLTMASQGGTISGNCVFAQNPGKSVTGRGSFSMNNIDVTETFTTFRNFGQDFIRSENLAGSLSGSLSLLLPLDSMLKPITGLITAEGKYLLKNGALLNFEPVKQLSSFIELSELENISFSQLENDFFIRSSNVYIPQMDVRSSAADLSVNGRHGFDNQYEYHVKVRLSEILSKKAGKKKAPSTEFGVIEDDGLGRTSVLLKVESQGDDIKVSYDVKAATSQIKDDIRNEREVLRKIIDQEYGRAGSDTGSDAATARKPRFRISWEERDSIRVEPETPAERREGPLRNLLRRK